MDLVVILGALTFALPGLLSWLLLPVTWNNRDRPGALGILVIIPSVSLYAIGAGITTVTTVPWLWYIGSNLVLLSLASAAVGWFLTATEYTGYIDRPLRALKTLGAILLIDQLLAWTNPLHHQYYDPLGTLSLPTGIAPNAGIIFFIHTMGAYLLVALGILACLNDALYSRGIRRKQTLALLGAVLPPIVTSILWLPRLTPLNYTPLTFVLSVSLLAWVLFEADFFDIVPRGRERAVMNMDDAMVILDDEGRVAETNSAARALFDAGTDWRGMSADAFFSPLTESFDQLHSGGKARTDVTLSLDGNRRYFDVTVTPLGQTDDESAGQVVLFRDITRVKRRQRTLQELQTQTERILRQRNRERIFAVTVEAGETVFGVSRAGAYLYNRRQEALVPVASSGDFDTLCQDNSPSPQGPDSGLWDVYSGEEAKQISDTTALNRLFSPNGTAIESVLMIPFGYHGILVLPALGKAFDDTDLYFARLLSTTVETALDKARRERGLAAVQDVTRDAMRATTHEEMSQAVLSQLPEALDYPLAGIWQHDPPADQLQPVATTGPADPLFETAPVFQPGNSIAWRAFEENQTKLVSQVADHPEAHNPDSPIRSEVLSPIGDFGVFAAGSTQPDSFTENERQILTSLSTNLETASRLIERRRDMRLLDQILGRILRHNLRNKLVVIQARAEQIRDSDRHGDSDLAEEILAAAGKLQATAGLAQDMRAVIKNRSDLDRQSLNEVVRAVVEAVSRDFPAATVQTTFDSDPTVLAHPYLSTAIAQLVRNAVEHGTTDESPTVTVRVFETPDGPTLEVADNGPGIPPHELEVLEKHGESALEHGSGVGLWIVDRVLEYSNASVEFVVDDGTTARITFLE